MPEGPAPALVTALTLFRTSAAKHGAYAEQCTRAEEVLRQLELDAKAAEETLGKLGVEETLALHADTVAAKLADSDTETRKAACLVMHRLKPSAGYDTVAKLEDLDGYPDADTRLDALKTLGKLDAATLAQHEQCLARVAGPGWEARVVREAAAQLLAELRGLGD